MSQRTRSASAAAAHAAMEATTATTTSSPNPQGVAELEMEKVRAVGDLELEYVAWSLPKTEPGEKRGRTKSAVITPLALFEPGSYFLKSSGGSESSWLKKRCSQFHSTLSTRCVRDIKRDFSWKLYGTCCNPDTGAESHFVRIKFLTAAADESFSAIIDLLNALAAKRFLQSSRKEKVHPFGIGFDCGVQKSKERLYIISNCAKQTPYLRRVAVDFEVLIDNEWKRLDATVDRIGFATYKSAPKSSVLAASTLDAISFKDDAYLRFARVTLRFGEQAERTVLDIGRGFEPALVYGKTSTILTMNRARVRTCEGSKVSVPVRSQVRLVFTDMKESRSRSGTFRRNSGGKHSASEAEKVLALLKKTVALAGVNTLGLEDDLEDDAIFQMNIQRLVTEPGYAIREKGEAQAARMNLSNHFKNSTLFLVPCYESNGVNLILQSRNGEYVLRQYINGPVRFIGSITSNCFAGPKFSTLVKHQHEYSGMGKVTYMFETQETDATSLVEILVSIIEKLHMFHTTVTSSTPNHVPSLPPSLPRIPAIPSIHLSRAGTVATTRNNSTRKPPAPSEISIPPIPVLARSAQPPPPVSEPEQPAQAPQPVYKVPRKPVPTSAHSRSVSSSTSGSTLGSTSVGTSGSTSITSSSSQPVRTLAPQRDPSALPGGRVYELRAATLKKVITTAGLQGTVQAVSTTGRVR
ncbi:uncharacterized protein LAJ45_03054 [Morchella importuna]|uniref:uncharacterized protein n=1 Tax=Morchella importuna TaxID=1174673 RepID=UPI001E8EBF5C|nr:uncharacterized protein LAJ45_03054 [Morchella importuna]KAH8152828.1 hypothetical protein LAJ45_03054 [Morchella importuna]